MHWTQIVGAVVVGLFYVAMWVLAIGDKILGDDEFFYWWAAIHVAAILSAAILAVIGAFIP